MSHKYMAGFSWSEKRSGACRHGNENGARVLAKSLVRLRGQRTKVMASSAQLRGVRASIGVSDCASTSPPNIVQDTHLQRGITRAKADTVYQCERSPAMRTSSAAHVHPEGPLHDAPLQERTAMPSDGSCNRTS